MAFSTYTFHAERGADLDAPGVAERALVVRDGFAWGAFFSPMLWFFAYRHWVAGLAALAIVVLLAVILRLVGFGIGPILAAEILLHWLIGFEGASLRRWLLARQGRPVIDVVQAGSPEEAEVKSFRRWVASETAPAYASAGSATSFPMRRDAGPIIGGLA